MIKIVNKEQYNHILKQNNQLSLANKNLASANGKTQKELENYKTKTQELEIDNAGLKDIINMQEKEISKLKSINQKLKSDKQKLSSEKGGLTKENHKLRSQLDAKDRVIEEYKMALEESEKRNQLQADKIQSLTKKTNHSIEEYKNNGLRKNMKKKRGN